MQRGGPAQDDQPSAQEHFDVRFAAEHIGDTVCCVGANGKLVYISPNVARIFGVSPSLLTEHGIESFLHLDDKAMLAALRTSLLTGVAAEETLNFRVLHPARGIVWVEARARRRIDMQNGIVDGFLVILRDVTARRAIEEAHGKAEAQFRMLAQNTSDAITCMNQELAHTYVSPSFGKMFGYRSEMVMGEPCARIVHPDDLAEVYRRLGKLTDGNSDHELVTYRLRHGRGHFVWVESNFTLLRDARTGRPASITCSVRDVTERRAQADALQAANAALQHAANELAASRDKAELASRAKSRFLANVSHELRTPLNGILGYAEILRGDTGLVPRQITQVDAIWSAGQHLLDMINSILSISEIEAEKLELNPAPISLDHVVSGCVTLLRPASLAKGLTLDAALAPGLPCNIVADRTRLRQVLLNLLGNAVKFTSAGGVTVRLLQTGPASLRIEVADTGPGIPRALRDKLFVEFERLDAPDGDSEGTGLGLALTARIVSLMRGRIGHDDNPGGGSLFWCELPLQVADAAPAEAMPTGRVATASGQKLRILVVDDIAMNRDVALSFLCAAGHEVALAEDGAVAADMAASADYDVILMDVRMPEVDGLEATRRIRRLESKRGRVPIVAVTAQAFAEQVRACREAGMDLHLAKPFSQTSLLAAVEDAIRGAPPNQETPESTESLTAAPTAPPLFDQAAYDDTAAFLEPTQIQTYMNTIVTRANDLRQRLSQSEGSAANVLDLVKAAHDFAGSAAMFGFLRVHASARRFERAAARGCSETEAAHLISDIEATLPTAKSMLAGSRV